MKTNHDERRGSFSSFLRGFHTTDRLHPTPDHPMTASTTTPPPIDDTYRPIIACTPNKHAYHPPIDDT